MKSVYSAVRTGSLNKAVCAYVFHSAPTGVRIVESATFQVENEVVLSGGEILSDYTASRYKKLCYVTFERK